MLDSQFKVAVSARSSLDSSSALQSLTKSALVEGFETAEPVKQGPESDCAEMPGNRFETTAVKTSDDRTKVAAKTPRMDQLQREEIGWLGGLECKWKGLEIDRKPRLAQQGATRFERRRHSKPVMRRTRR